MITVLGYGSLLSEQSARDSAANLRNFRPVVVQDFIRIFNKVGIYLFREKIVSESDLEIAVCCARAKQNSQLHCSAFDCTDDDFAKIFNREHRYKWLEIEYLDSNGNKGLGQLATEWNDHEYLHNRCESSSEYELRVGQYYKGKIWRSDILPHPNYLKFCLIAAKNLGPDIEKNFANNSFLADGKTTIGEYLKLNPHIWKAKAEV